MTTLFTIVTLALVTTYISVKSSYYILRFFAGAFWWALAAWLAYNPLMAGANPVNDIMFTLCIFVGFAVMFMMGWRTDSNGEGRFNIRLPSIFGGMSEDEEAEFRSSRSYANRQARYRERLNNTIRGRR